MEIFFHGTDVIIIFKFLRRKKENVGDHREKGGKNLTGA
jgi:hypothetical protein